jgi:hypothetical protein
MNNPDDSRLAARLVNNTFLADLPIRERQRVARALDRAVSFEDLPPVIGEQVERAMKEYRLLKK